MARTLTKQKPVKDIFYENLFDVISNPKSPISNESDETWNEIPVTAQEFCTNWLNESLFPIQEQFVNAMIGDDPFDFNVAYEEGHGFWGKGCVIGSTLLKDESSGKEYSIKELADNQQNIVVKSYDTIEHKITNCETGVPFSKGIAKIFKVKTKSGNEIIVSNEHKFYSKGVWLPLSELKVGDKILINNVEKEKSRREKISYSTIGKPKSENHKKNMNQDHFN